MAWNKDGVWIATETETVAWLETLASRNTREGILAAIYDLRDNAYDLPTAWVNFAPARFFYFLCEALEVAEEEGSWAQFARVLATATRMTRSEAGTSVDQPKW